MTTQNKKQISEIYAHYFRNAFDWNKDRTDKEINKGILEVVRFSDGEMVAIEKCSRLDTEFWIAEGRDAGRTFDEAQEICRDINQNKAANFINYNTEHLEAEIQKIDKYIDYLKGDICCISGGDVFYFEPVMRDQSPANPLRNITYNLPAWVVDGQRNLKALNLQDAEIYKAAIRKKEEQVKRCNTYLKRFGTDKIHARSYWADR